MIRNEIIIIIIIKKAIRKGHQLEDHEK